MPWLADATSNGVIKFFEHSDGLGVWIIRQIFRLNYKSERHLQRFHTLRNLITRK
jgi:hypothetical protein